MGKYGINAPPGMAIQKIEDLLPAAKKMADENGEVYCCFASSSLPKLCLHACRCLTYLPAHSEAPSTTSATSDVLLLAYGNV